MQRKVNSVYNVQITKIKLHQGDYREGVLFLFEFSIKVLTQHIQFHQS